MPKLPTNGKLNWGNDLNQFLEVSHVNDDTADSGKVKIESLKTSGTTDADKVLATNSNGVVALESKDNLGHTIQNSTTTFTKRKNLKFDHQLLTVVDNSANNATVVSIDDLALETRITTYSKIDLLTLWMYS